MYLENSGNFVRVLTRAISGFAIVLWALSAASVSATTIDQSMVVGPENKTSGCLQCHKTSGQVWEGTHHFKTFREMPRNKDARKIAKRMGFKLIKKADTCLGCHFTSAPDDRGKPKPVAGISCESCHGGGKLHAATHGKYSGKGKGKETDDEIAARWAKSEEEGLIRPKAIYQWAKNCYGCHTVPDEKLVNVGLHNAGSKFELVAWSQGEVRHNVWYSKKNREATADRKRLMYVIGQAVELETSLRAVGKATQKKAKGRKKSYAVLMAKRASNARKRFKKIAAAIDLPEIKAINAAAADAKLKLNNDAQLTKIADAIGEQAQMISANYDGSRMSAIDGMLPSAEKYKGKAAAHAQ